MENFHKEFFGYSKVEVEEAFLRMNAALETAEKNVEYLSKRVEELEVHLAKYEKNSREVKTWHVDDAVVESIQKSLKK